MVNGFGDGRELNALFGATSEELRRLASTLRSPTAARAIPIDAARHRLTQKRDRGGDAVEETTRMKPRAVRASLAAELRRS